MASPNSFNDSWQWYLSNNSSFLCNECGSKANLPFNRGLDYKTPEGKELFINRAIVHLIEAGWKLIYGRPYCPACAKKLDA